MSLYAFVSFSVVVAVSVICSCIMLYVFFFCLSSYPPLHLELWIGTRWLVCLFGLGVLGGLLVFLLLGRYPLCIHTHILMVFLSPHGVSAICVTGQNRRKKHGMAWSFCHILHFAVI